MIPPRLDAPRRGRPTGRTALHTLLVDEGAGAPLAAAAGDVASRGRGYSARTQASTVVAYHLIGHGAVDRPALIEELLALAGDDGGVYVAPSAELQDWLASARSARPAATAVPSAEPATRAVPIGVWFRRQPDALVRSAIEVARIENFDACTVVAAAAAAGAVAASTLVMSGFDLVLAAGEIAERAAVVIAEDSYRFSRAEAAPAIGKVLRSGRDLVGRSAGDAAAIVEDRGIPATLAPVLAAIVVAADPGADPVLAIEDAAVNTGPDAGALAGAMIGARVGLRRWPWSVPNETWFAEIGRRLVAGDRELRDLPVPLDVEQRMHDARRVDPREEVE